MTQPSAKQTAFVKLALTNHNFRVALYNAYQAAENSDAWNAMSAELTDNGVYDPNDANDQDLLEKCLKEIVLINWSTIHDMEIKLGRNPELVKDPEGDIFTG